MEYWKIKPNSNFCNFNQRHWDSLMHKVDERQTSTPILHHSLKLLQTEPIISDPRKWEVSMFE
jgi:hypothetical protein